MKFEKIDFEIVEKLYTKLVIDRLNNELIPDNPYFNMFYDTTKDYLHHVNMSRLVGAAYEIANRVEHGQIDTSGIEDKLQNIAEMIDIK